MFKPITAQTQDVKLPEPALRQPESEHDGDGGPLVDYFTADQVRAAVLAERERIARVAENTHPNDWAFIAAAIRSGS